MSVSFDHFQLWDLADDTWGSSIDLGEADVEVNNNGMYLLGGTRFATRPLGDDAPRLAVFDLATDDPNVPILVVGPGPDAVRSVAPLGQDQILVKTGSPSTANGSIAVWSLTNGEVIHQLEDVATNIATSANGDIYFVNDELELWLWQPPAAPLLVSPDIKFERNGPSQMQVGASGRVLMARSNSASVWSPGSDATVALTGVEPDDDPTRFRTISIGELPDGRIVTAYPDKRLAYWDVDRPDAPTIEVIQHVIQQMAVLSDGRLIVSLSPDNDMDPNEIQVITPPAP